MMLDAPIYLSLRPSRRLRAAVIVSHCTLLSLFACWRPYHVASRLVAVIVIVSLVAYVVKLWKPPVDAIEGLLLHGDERWEVKTRGRPAVSAELLSGAFVTPWLTVLRFYLADGRRRAAFVLPDNAPAEPFRRLRVRLRLTRKPAGAAPVNR